MKKNILDKLFNFLEKEVTPPIKKDLKWLSKTITKDLEKLTTEKKSKKNNNKKDYNIICITHTSHLIFKKNF